MGRVGVELICLWNEKRGRKGRRGKLGRLGSVWEKGEEERK